MGRAAAALRLAAFTAALACLAFAGPAQAKPAKHGPTGTEVKVMTRNVFLGADLGPALKAGSTSEFIEANGAILRQVEATNFPVRARGLAKEVL